MSASVFYECPDLVRHDEGSIVDDQVVQGFLKSAQGFVQNGDGFGRAAQIQQRRTLMPQCVKRDRIDMPELRQKLVVDGHLGLVLPGFVQGMGLPKQGADRRYILLREHEKHARVVLY